MIGRRGAPSLPAGLAGAVKAGTDQSAYRVSTQSRNGIAVLEPRGAPSHPFLDETRLES